MNRPQRFRGLATDPGVQRKAPKAVFWRTGSRLEKQSEIQAGDCASSGSRRTDFLDALGNRRIWKINRTTEQDEMSKEITFETETLTVDKPGRYANDFRVTADINPPELLNQFDAKEILEHADRDELLDEIGEDYAREYFGIEPEDK